MLWHSTTNNSKQPLVLIHGWGFNADIFQSIISNLEQKYKVILFDLPGFGRSDFLKGGLNEWLDIIVKIIPLNSIIVGWSLGGLVAIKIAEIITTKKLILLASSPCFVRKKDWQYGISTDNFIQFAKELNINAIKTLQNFASLQTKNKQYLNTINRNIAKYKISTKALNQGLDILLTNDLRDNFINLKCQKQGILGKYDTLVSAKISKWYKEQNIDYYIIKSGHLLFLNEDFKL